jgi:threonine/homoserine/homoserine lactone efflux protein
MGDAIGETLGFAIGIAVSPIPIAAVILMLFSGRARSNSVSFMIAWIAGIAVVTAVVVAIPGLEADDSAPSTTTGWVKLALGVLLLAVGVRQWGARPGPDDEAAVPGWMASIDELRPGAAFGLGFLLSALNPKNLLLAAAAGASLGALPLSTGETVGAVAVFTAIAALTVAVPVVAYLIAGERLDPTLDRTKAWLIANNTAVMAVLLLVFGVSLLGDALQILL